jgi:hypothetical protein
MGYTSADCDDCKKPIAGEMFQDHDGLVRCERCDVIDQIDHQQRNLDHDLDHIKRVYIPGIKKARGELKVLKARLASI